MAEEKEYTKETWIYLGQGICTDKKIGDRFEDPSGKELIYTFKKKQHFSVGAKYIAQVIRTDSILLRSGLSYTGMIDDKSRLELLRAEQRAFEAQKARMDEEKRNRDFEMPDSIEKLCWLRSKIPYLQRRYFDEWLLTYIERRSRELTKL